MISELLGAAQSVQSLLGLLKAASGLANYSEIVAAVADVNTKLLQANAVALSSQAEQAALLVRIRELETKITQFDEWERISADYELKDLAFGVFAYLFRPSAASQKPPHFACAKCFQERRLSILQREYPPSYKCVTCGADIEPIKDGGLVRPDQVP